MKKSSVNEYDRPYFHRPRRALNPWVAVMAVGGTAWIIAFSSRLLLNDPRPVEATPPVSAAAPAAEIARPVAAPPAVRHRLPPAAETSPPLPQLEHSDPLLRRSIAGLVGQGAFAQFVVPEALVRRIVATVDNLPRPTAPRRVLPLNPVQGTFLTRPNDDGTIVDPANFARYEPYVRAFELVVPSALVLSYVRTYPLFQRAYEALGYPGRYFNDRLIEALDDLLLAPEIDSPPRLLRGRVLYEFADPDLETRSAGQKMLLRMGADNSRRVKAKLWEIRRELLKVSAS